MLVDTCVVVVLVAVVVVVVVIIVVFIVAFVGFDEVVSKFETDKKN